MSGSYPPSSPGQPYGGPGQGPYGPGQPPQPGPAQQPPGQPPAPGYGGGFPGYPGGPSSQPSAPSSQPSAPGWQPAGSPGTQPSAPTYLGPGGAPGSGQPGFPPAGGSGYGQPAGPGQPGGYGPPGPGQPGGYAGPGQPGGYGGSAGPGQPGAPGGPAPYAPAPYQNATPKKPVNKGLIGGIIGGVAVIVIAAIVIGLLINRSGPGHDGGPSGTPPPPATAANAVKGFLEAVAAGDADQALSYAKETPDDTTFITKEVLAASAKAYPITDINVPEASSDYQVAATYKIGSQTVNAKYSTEKIGDNYKITEIASEVRLSSTLADGLTMKINGVAVDPSTTSVMLLPGGYTVSADSKWVGYGNGKIVITSPDDYADTSKLQPAMKSTATAAVVKAAKAKLATCIKQKSLKPAGCGISLAPNSTQKVTTSSIKYTVKSGGDFKGLKLRLDYDDPTTATATISLKLAFAASGTCSGKKCTFSADLSVYGLNADLSKDTPAVTFERF